MDEDSYDTSVNYAIPLDSDADDNGDDGDDGSDTSDQDYDTSSLNSSIAPATSLESASTTRGSSLGSVLNSLISGGQGVDDYLGELTGVSNDDAVDSTPANTGTLFGYPTADVLLIGGAALILLVVLFAKK